MLCVFTLLSWTAAETRNATIDEPLHLSSGWVELRCGDFRLFPESPPLLHCWAALPNIAAPLAVRFDAPPFTERSFDSQAGINWACRTLYQTPGNDGKKLIRRSRLMMLVPAVVLGGLIGLWAFELAGGAAAVTAVALFSLDPNLLAHAPMIKGDVPLSLLMLAAAYFTWKLGRRAGAGRCIAVGVICGVAVNVKFSGLLLPIVLGVLLLIRGLMPAAWVVLGRCVETRRGRLLAGFAIWLAAVGLCWAITWASYGFRFLPSRSPTAQMNMPAIRQRTLLLEAAAVATHDPTPEEIARWKPSLLVRLVDFANAHCLLPQAMLGGLMYQHACMQIWPSYLLGRLYGVGRWYYFPLAVLFKTPLATLAAIALAGLMFLLHLLRARRIPRLQEPNALQPAHPTIPTSASWSLLCLLIPFGMFFSAALDSNVDIGLRNILPIYPFMFIAVGVMAGRFMQQHRRPAIAVLILLTVGLATETIGAWPDFIPFFNVACGGKRGGFGLLGDSNLDWGQDLKSLADWQREHPRTPLFLHFFGSVPPDVYGLKCHSFEVSADGKKLISDVSMSGGILAVSTNYLQGLHDTANDFAFFTALGRRPPDELVGGSIYLYRYPIEW
jgi:hypothetical protein